MRVLVACEFSGIVRDAFNRRGHLAASCDLEPSETVGEHYRCDVREVLGMGWDLVIAHPPCTYLAVCGARWFKGREREQDAAVAFVRELWSCPAPHVCIENPKSVLSTRWMRPTQTVQPYLFGHPHRKLTCLWLRGLPPLKATSLCPFRDRSIHMMGQSRNRSRDRSRTFSGIAEAMAEQWSRVG